MSRPEMLLSRTGDRSLEMRRRLVLAALLCSTVPAVATDIAAERAKLEGVWTAMSAQRDGKEAADLVGHRLELAGDRFRISAQGKTLYAGTYTIDPAPQPPHIDFRHDEGAAMGQMWQGIYWLEGGTLSVCDNAADPAKPRPQELAATSGSGHVLIVFRP
jgi:uncharacterized protein (TIGR03067 family)